MTRPNVSRYNSLGTAIRASLSGTKAQQIVLGDDKLYWVCFMAEATRLERAGYAVLAPTREEIAAATAY